VSADPKLVGRNAAARCARLSRVIDGLRSAHCHATKLDGFTSSELGYIEHLIRKAGDRLLLESKHLPLTK
jgi:hypothetical protein